MMPLFPQLPGVLPAAAQPSIFHRMFFRDVGATDSAVYSDALFMLTWWFGVFWFVLLMGLMVYWVIKYRRRPGVPAPISPSHNTTLEVFWTIVPSASLLVIFFFGFWGYMKKVVPAGDAMELQVSAWKWGWGITYPNGAQSQWTSQIDSAEFDGDGAGLAYPVFVLPEDTNISLRMNSQDVIHSFWIPDLRIKMDVYPNRYTGYGFTTPVLNADDQVTLPDGQRVNGRSMWVFCAEYCGDMHAEMAALMYVLPRKAYEEALASWSTDGLSPVELGKIVYAAKCMICHSVDGSSGAGPTWAGGEFGGQAYGYGYPVNFTDGTSLE
ncbi:MAG: cytochrome c oxidase subunit II, partial [Planctomycetota bacterium]